MDINHNVKFINEIMYDQSKL